MSFFRHLNCTTKIKFAAVRTWGESHQWYNADDRLAHSRSVIFHTALFYKPSALMGNFLEGQAQPNVFAFAFHRTRFFYFLWREVFNVCFPVVQGSSLRLLCLFSNSFQFKFFIYSLYIHIYIFYIFSHCTCGALQCSHGLWSLCRANSRWQTRSPAVGAL